MDAKRVLIITYCFPPRPGISSLRLKGLAKYLPEFGWEPVILTTNLPGEPDKCFRVIQTPYPGDVSALLKKGLNSNQRRVYKSKSAFQYLCVAVNDLFSDDWSNL